MPVDPVCGIELDEDIALIHDHKGENFYFCCNGCRKIFIKKPRKYKKTYETYKKMQGKCCFSGFLTYFGYSLINYWFKLVN